MRKIFKLISKDFRLLTRSKTSLAILILAPILTILLIGISYNTSQNYSLEIGVFSENYGEGATSLIELVEANGFSVTKYDQIDSCIEDIKTALTNTCIHLPSELTFTDNSKKEITYYVDQSKMNLVWVITKTLQENFNLKAAELSEQIASDILSKVANTKSQITAKKIILDQSTSQAQAALSNTGTVQSELTKLDLSIPETAFNVSVSGSFGDDIGNALDEGKGKLSDAKSTVQGSNLGDDEKESVLESISEARSKLNSIENKFTGNGSSFGEITNLISSLNDELASARGKLTLAASKQTELNSKLSTINSDLSTTAKNLEDLQSTLGSIETELSSLSVTDASTVANPLVTKIETIAHEDSYMGYLFPTLIMIVVMFLSILLGTTLVMMEKHTPAYFRNFILPVRKVSFVLATYMTNLMIIFVQIAIILGAALYFLSPEILPRFPLTLLILFLASSVFTLLGMAIGYIFTSEDAGILASIFFGSLMLFFSGVIIPIETLPKLIKEIVFFNPYILCEKLLRGVFIFGSEFNSLINDLIIIIGYIILIFLFIVVYDLIASRHFYKRVAYHHHRKIRRKKARMETGKR
jgi:ABC-2 type transport system permease protein